MMDAVSLMIGIGVMAVSIIIGYRARTVSHAILPIRDPILLIVMVLEIIVVMVDATKAVDLGMMYMDGDVLTITDIGMTVLMMMGAFDMGYVLGYAMCRPGDVLMLDMPLGDGYDRSEVVPVVTYVKYGNLYMMPQTVGGIIMSFMGARHPIDIPISEVSRTRSYYVSNGGIRPPIEIRGAIVVSSHETEDIPMGLWRIGSRKIRDENRNIIAESPRYLIHTIVTRHVIRFAWSATDDYQLYQVKTGLYRTAMDEAREAEERSARLEIQIQSLQFDAAADIVAGLISITRDAPGANDEILRIINSLRESLTGQEVSDADS